MSDGYFQTPNIMVPHNNRERGTIAPIAKRQLEVITKFAHTWPIVQQGNKNICGLCSQNVWFTDDKHGSPFLYQDEEITALIVAHIRQNHQEAIDVSGVV